MASQARLDAPSYLGPHWFHTRDSSWVFHSGSSNTFKELLQGQWCTWGSVTCQSEGTMRSHSLERRCLGACVGCTVQRSLTLWRSPEAMITPGCPRRQSNGSGSRSVLKRGRAVSQHQSLSAPRVSASWGCRNHVSLMGTCRALGMQPDTYMISICMCDPSEGGRLLYEKRPSRCRPSRLSFPAPRSSPSHTRPWFVCTINPWYVAQALNKACMLLLPNVPLTQPRGGLSLVCS